VSNASPSPEGRDSFAPEGSNIQDYTLLGTNTDALFTHTLPYHPFDVCFALAAKLNFKLVQEQQLLLNKADPWCTEASSKSDIKKPRNPPGGAADWEVLHSRPKLPSSQLPTVHQSPRHAGFQLKPPASERIPVRDTVLQSPSQSQMEQSPSISGRESSYHLHWIIS